MCTIKLAHDQLISLTHTFSKEQNVSHIFTRHIRKVRAVSLYLNIGGSEQSCTHAAPSIECLRSH